jgi:hypothetical protein
MINIPETYQIIILVIVLLLIGYYALVLNKKVEGFGFIPSPSDIGNAIVDTGKKVGGAVVDTGKKAVDYGKDLAGNLLDSFPSVDDVFNPIKDWIRDHLLSKINEIKRKISELPETAKNKILEVLKQPISFVKDIIQKVGEIKDKVSGLPEIAKNKILGLLEKPISFVKNIVQNAKNVFTKVFNTIKNIITTMVNFIKDKLKPFIGDKLNFIKTFVMDKISPILNKTLGFVVNKLKKVWEIAINATGIPDLLQTGYYIALGFLVCGIALNSFSIFNHLMTPVKCHECSCTCD